MQASRRGSTLPFNISSVDRKLLLFSVSDLALCIYYFIEIGRHKFSHDCLIRHLNITCKLLWHIPESSTYGARETTFASERF
jgi:hypothetical protein